MKKLVVLSVSVVLTLGACATTEPTSEQKAARAALMLKMSTSGRKDRTHGLADPKTGDVIIDPGKVIQPVKGKVAPKVVTPDSTPDGVDTDAGNSTDFGAVSS